MRVVTGGCGRGGSYPAVMKEREGHTAAGIDKDPEWLENLWCGFSGETLFLSEPDRTEELGELLGKG